MDRRRQRVRLAGIALFPGIDDLDADGVGHARDRDVSARHALDDLGRAPQADRQMRARIVAVLEELVVVLEALGDLVGRYANLELAARRVVDQSPTVRPPIEIEIEPYPRRAPAPARKPKALL